MKNRVTHFKVPIMQIKKMEVEKEIMSEASQNYIVLHPIKLINPSKLSTTTNLFRVDVTQLRNGLLSK